MFLVGALVVPLALIVEIAFQPPVWLHLVIWLPLATALCLVFLPPFKGVLYALQLHHKAEEGRLEP